MTTRAASDLDPRPAQVLDPHLLADITSAGAFDATACMNCGVCTAVCPAGLHPRQLFHQVVLGKREQLLAETEAVYSCLLCHLCETSCPAGVHITANVRALRHYLNRHVFGI